MEEKAHNVSFGSGGQDRPEIDLASPHEQHMVPVWFFVGVILFIYGIIITASGIYELSSPPLPALAKMPPIMRHPAVWWGALLTVIGAIYVIAYRPKKS
jgi:hypothetical protein